MKSIHCLALPCCTVHTYTHTCIHTRTLMHTDHSNELLYEILFDEEFLGCLTLRCSQNRAYCLPPSCLVNISYGKRLEFESNAQKHTPGRSLQNYTSPPISTAMLQLLHHHATAKAPPLTVIPSFGQNTVFQVLLCRTISIHPPSNTRHKDMMQWMHTLPTMTVAMLTTPLAPPPTYTDRGVWNM